MKDKKEVATVRKGGVSADADREHPEAINNTDREGCNFPLATTPEKVSEVNKALKEELWARGYYVMEIGGLQFGEADYLVVSASLPKQPFS